jgi:NADH-quinone oxidoreductase subunit L
MTIPLLILAAFAVLLGLIGTPAWPWFQSFLDGNPAELNFAVFSTAGLLPVMVSSSLLVFVGLGLGWWFYGRTPIKNPDDQDALGQFQPNGFAVLGHGFYVDALYGATVIRLNAWWSRVCDWFDRWIWNGAVQVVSHLVLGFAWLDNFVDTQVVNSGFDEGCRDVSWGGQMLSRLQGGRVQNYLRMIGFALIVLVLFLLWEASG